MDALTANEISRRYNGTYAFVSHGGKEFGVRFRDFTIDEDNDNYTAVVDVLRPKDPSRTELKVLDLDETHIHHIQHNSLFNYGKTVCLYARRPVRQWRKGYSGENTVLFDVIVSSMQAHGIGVVSDPFSNIDISSVEAFHNPNFCNFFEEGITRIEKEERIGVAVNSSFGIGRSFLEGVDYILYFMNTAIAHIIGNKVITLTMEQEVRDFFKYHSRGGYNVTT